MEKNKNYHFEDFTEKNYRNILKTISGKGTFCSYKDLWQGGGQKIIWRHDIDISAHRALWMAQAEQDEGIHAVYFVLLNSKFYNMMEQDIYHRLIAIKNLGHEIGIHLDCDSLPDDVSEEVLCRYLRFLKGIYVEVFQQEMHSFSFHNPSEKILKLFDKEEYVGLCNAYSEKIRKNIAYCSDSNGYWRFQRLQDFLLCEKQRPICVLTHPVWWTPEIMSPAKRVKRAIEGRKKDMESFYEAVLQRTGRMNVK
ncbi:MAG: hypothetical protein K2N87_09155 [Eubacterium sp.]|nr:hypothetical protein [Eubacterium sp.]